MIALSVAAALAVFVLYTAVAGNGDADVKPSELAGHTGTVSLVGKVVGAARGDAHTAGGLRFVLARHRRATPRASRSSTTARARPVQGGRDVVVDGHARERRSSSRTRLADDEVPDQVRAGEASST